MAYIPLLRLLDEREWLTAALSLEDLMNHVGVSGRYRFIPSYNIGHQSHFPDIIAGPGGRDVPDWWATDPPIIRGEVTIYRIEHGFYFPYFGVVVSAEGIVCRATYAEAKFVVPRLAMLPNSVQLDDGVTALKIPSSVPKIEEINVTFPWGAGPGYGHFVLDCLPGISFLMELGLGNRNFVFPPLCEWHREHLDLLCVRRQELSDTVYEVRDVVFTSCMDHMLQAPNSLAINVRNRQLSRHVSRLNSPPKRLYISRMKNETKYYDNEFRLEEVLIADGFVIIHPEVLSVQDQISIFSAAEVVAGFFGGGFANILYCRPGTEVIEIQSAVQGGIWVRNLAILTGCVWRPFFCDGNPLDSHLVINADPQPALGGRAHLNIDDLMDFLRSRSDGKLQSKEART